jgi:hypothetical protein
MSFAIQPFAVAQALPTDTADNTKKLPTYSADKTAPPPDIRPRNDDVNNPLNPTKDFYGTVKTKVPGGGVVNTRVNDGGVRTLPSDTGTQPVAPQGNVNPVRVDGSVPLGNSGISATVRLENQRGSQTFRPGLKLTLPLEGEGKGNVEVVVTNKTSIQTPEVNRTELKGSITLPVGSGGSSVGVTVTRETGGTAKQTGTTGVTGNVTVVTGGTEVQASYGATFKDNRTDGAASVGAAITVQPQKPDETKPYGYGGAKITTDEKTGNTDISVFGGARF